MSSGRATRAREPVNYSESAKNNQAPAWVKEIVHDGAPGSASQHGSAGKENAQQQQRGRAHGKAAAAAAAPEPAGKKTKVGRRAGRCRPDGQLLAGRDRHCLRPLGHYF